ncbi:MAG TPA: glycosyltransferase family 1 protein [Aestuariivirgaceae bacterium]|jgi:glycosyltransferase involved in cell wall biosynthesis|nr:glycosyltransferase family 1 protein [Aestuariivirgaceae bacterium]
MNQNVPDSAFWNAGSSGPLRVVVWCGNYNYVKDGAVVALNRLVQHLESKAVPVMVVAPLPGEPVFESYGTVTPVPSVPIPGRSEYRLTLGIPRSVRDKIAAFRPTLFHVASPDPLGLAAVRLANRWQLPCVASYHSRHDIYSHYYGVGFLARPWQHYLRWLYSTCAQLYAPSEEVVALLRADRIGRDVRLWTRGVDLNRFNPDRRSQPWRRAMGFADDDVVVAFISRLVAEKNIGLVQEVLQLLEQRGVPHRQLFVGEGPERARLQAKLPNAVFTGFLDGDALSTAYASADVFFFPSVTETFGIVTLEAMASGLPAVCANATGSASLVKPGDTGFLVEETDKPGFADAIARLVSDPALRRRMGANAVARSRSYSWRRAMETLEGYYYEVLAGEGH